MLFDDAAWEELAQAYITGEKLIISACNCLSQEFVTEGKVAPVRAKEIFEDYQYPNDILAGFTEDTLVLEFGKKKDDDLRTKYTATFLTDLYEDDCYKFLINEIKLKSSGKTIFKNADYQALRKFCRTTLIEYGKHLLRQDITPGTMDSKCQYLTNFIGKPIDIFGETGVLFFVDSKYKGEILLYILDFAELKAIKIPKNASIIEGKNLIKIKQSEKHSSFEDFLIDYSRRKK